MNSFGPVLAVLPFRYAAARRTDAALKQAPATGARVFELPRREFRADLAAWTAIGLLTVAVYHLFYDPYLSTGLKIFVGCLAFGIFGGMLSYLATEKRVIHTLENYPDAGLRIDRILSVRRKMLTLVVTVLTMMAMAILLMVLLDVYYLVENLETPGPHLYWGVFKEIFFALAVLLTLSLLVIRRFSANLEHTLGIQLAAMEEISNGNLEKQVPVMTDDEFARLAQKTNEMIGGLREREVCRTSFDRYVSPEVSTKILEERISPEGELCRVTVLFCDLRGYTSFVEQRDPREVVAFMNRYFTAMEAVIRANRGIVLQYIGDEIEAVFGAPVVVADHADRAVAAALEMRRALVGLNAQDGRSGEDAIRHGIGIHSGTVLAGNVGSRERMVYAMVGDTVNVASRLQVLNKTVGTDILLSRTTADRLRRPPEGLRTLGLQPIKGKTEEVEVLAIDDGGPPA